jgi:glycerate 2-kinase
VIDRRGLREHLPAPVVAHLEAGAHGTAAEGPVARSDPRLAHAAYRVVASRHDAMNAAAATARTLGYRTVVVSEARVGEARVAAADFLRAAADLKRPGCLISSGETTVHVRGAGRGGRNQEFALAGLEPLWSMAPAGLASIGTDGCDGPTDAAGAIVDSAMWDSPGARAADIAAALADNDAYPVLERLGALVRTGPTGTNVGDLQVLLLP